MNLIKRFAYYFGGFSIGIIIVIFMWSGKETSCSYFPNSRVLKEIRSKTQEISPAAMSFFENEKIDTLAISKLLHQGKVHFDVSQTNQKNPCRIYVVTGIHQEKDLQIKVEECKETPKIATIIEAEYNQLKK